MQMTGNTILITGGGSGIGRALAEAFHARQPGCHRRPPQELLDETTAANPGMKPRSSISGTERDPGFAAQTQSRLPGPERLINNAGIMRLELLRMAQLTDAEATVTTNLLGPIRLTAALLPLLRKQPRAAIMKVSSGLAFVPMATTPTYCATKAAIHSYTRSLATSSRTLPCRCSNSPALRADGIDGARQANDPDAMPLKDFIAETMNILKTSPDTTEICVERVKPFRFAEANGSYDAFFKKFNDAVAATIAHA